MLDLCLKLVSAAHIREKYRVRFLIHERKRNPGSLIRVGFHFANAAWILISLYRIWDPVHHEQDPVALIDNALISVVIIHYIL